MAVEAEKRSKFDVYAAMMLLASVFLLTGTIFLAMELSNYSGGKGFINGYPWWKTPAQGTGS